MASKALMEKDEIVHLKSSQGKQKTPEEDLIS